MRSANGEVRRTRERALSGGRIAGMLDKVLANGDTARKSQDDFFGHRRSGQGRTRPVIGHIEGNNLGGITKNS